MQGSGAKRRALRNSLRFLYHLRNDTRMRAKDHENNEH